MIGLSVTCAVIVFGPVTGASLNPARSFGPVLATALGGGDAAWGDFPVYILGPLIGGAAAAFAYDAIARPRLVEAEPPQGTEGDIRARKVTPEPADAGRQGTGGDIAGRRR